MLAIWPIGLVWSKAVAETAHVVAGSEHSFVVRFGSNPACRCGRWLFALPTAKLGRPADSGQERSLSNWHLTRNTKSCNQIM